MSSRKDGLPLRPSPRRLRDDTKPPSVAAVMHSRPRPYPALRAPMGRARVWRAALMSVSKARSRVANEVKKARKEPGGSSTGRVEDARRALAEEKLANFIQRTVAQAPALTGEQR